MQTLILVWCAAQAVAFVVATLAAIFDRRKDPSFEGDKIIYRS